MKPNWTIIVLGAFALCLIAGVAVLKGPMFGAVLGGVMTILGFLAPQAVVKAPPKLPVIKHDDDEEE